MRCASLSMGGGGICGVTGCNHLARFCDTGSCCRGATVLGFGDSTDETCDDFGFAGGAGAFDWRLRLPWRADRAVWRRAPRALLDLVVAAGRQSARRHSAGVGLLTDFLAAVSACNRPAPGSSTGSFLETLGLHDPGCYRHPPPWPHGFRGLMSATMNMHTNQRA